MNLVIDIGNTRIKGAYFEGDRLVEVFEGLEFGKYPVQKTLVASVDSGKNESVFEALKKLGIAYTLLDVKAFAPMLDVIDKNEVGADRIANMYGALTHFPLNDCVIVDIGTAVTFDFVQKEGRYLGGAIYPGAGMSAESLHTKTHALPHVKIEHPLSVLGKTTEEHIQIGIMYGMLGAIERIVYEMRHLSPGSQVIATGGMTMNDEWFANELEDFVDLIDPNLTLIGLKEILKDRGR
jgi:type III pantothenate kinase